MPGEWMEEMQSERSAASSRAGIPHERASERRREVSDVDDRRQPQRFGKGAEEEDDEGYQIPFLRFGITLVLAIIATAFTLYYGKMKATPSKPILRPVSISGVVDGDLSMVYEYISTADYRTEWHMAAVEVSGPAIDHSAVPGEVFTEELQIEEKNVFVQWDVLERQYPSTKDAKTAEFVLEGTAQIDGKVREQWKQTFRMRAGVHHFAKTPQVNLDIELLLGDDDGKPFTKKQKRWRKLLLAGLRESLSMLRMRIEELAAVQRRAEERKTEEKEKRKKK